MAQSQEMRLMKSRPSEFMVVKTYKDDTIGNARNGDVFIVQRDKKIHSAGVYLDGQIIQLKNISKVNVMEFTEGNRFAIYRKIRGIPQSFKENVDEALSSPEIFSRYNCIEFAMELLDMNLKPTESDCKKIASGAKPKGFKVVKGFSDHYRGNAKLGDLFLVQSGICGFTYYHAGVFCHEKRQEIIQFTPNTNGSLGMSSVLATASSPSACEGLVNKVHINMFTTGKKFAIYRRKMGIPQNFLAMVDEAMSQMRTYQLSKNNCVHFALELICEGLEKTEKNVESLGHDLFGDLK